MSEQVIPEPSDEFRPNVYSLSNSEVLATGTLCGGAVSSISRELIASRHTIAEQAATIERLKELARKSHKALRDLSTEEIYWQFPSAYWTETDCPGDQMWDTIYLLDAALNP